MPELSTPIDTVRYLIVTARAYDAELPPTDPDEGSNPSDDNQIDVLEEGPDQVHEREIAGTLDSLGEDQLAEIVALTWVGRGDFSAEEWDDALAEAASAPQRRRAKDYLLGEPLMGDLLEEGLAALGLAGAEADPDRANDDDLITPPED